MGMHELNLQSLMESLDGGRISEAFQHELRRCIADCDDRPGDDKDRVVTLQFKMSPICDDRGHCDEVKGKFHVSSTVPKRRSKVYSFGVRKKENKHQLVFNDLSDDNIGQKTIDE